MWSQSEDGWVTYADLNSISFVVDRCSLEDPGTVEKIQVSLLRLLESLLKERYGKDGGKQLSKIMDVFVKLRGLNEEFLMLYRKICQDKFLIEHLPELLQFLFDEWRDFPPSRGRCLLYIHFLFKEWWNLDILNRGRCLLYIQFLFDKWWNLNKWWEQISSEGGGGLFTVPPVERTNWQPDWRIYWTDQWKN